LHVRPSQALALLLGLGFASAACRTRAPATRAPATARCPIGEPGGPITLEVVARSPNGVAEAVTEGGVVTLEEAPQGGYVIFAGARASNLDGCAVELEASLRDVCSGRVVSIEGRPVDLAVGADGVGAPKDPAELTNYANLSVCPNAALGRDAFGQPYLLELRITDAEGRTAQTSVHVTPVCAEPSSPCVCECRPSGAGTCSLGGGVPADSGLPAGACPAPGDAADADGADADAALDNADAAGPELQPGPDR
jgi:hypothetical protein